MESNILKCRIIFFFVIGCGIGFLGGVVFSGIVIFFYFGDINSVGVICVVFVELGVEVLLDFVEFFWLVCFWGGGDFGWVYWCWVFGGMGRRN